MNIIEYINTYCQDMIEKHKKEQVLDWTEFPYQDIVTINDKPTPVIFINGHPVPVAQFLELSKDSFVSTYKYPDSGEIYDNYINNLNILEGPDVVCHYQMLARRAIDKNSENLILAL